MRRIRDIEALDILIRFNKGGFYRVALQYALMPPRQEPPGDDGFAAADTETGPEVSFTKEDFADPVFAGPPNELTIEPLISRN
jgi:hypothetical protein